MADWQVRGSQPNSSGHDGTRMSGATNTQSATGEDDTSAEMDHSSNLKWAMIGRAVGIAIGVSISIASARIYNICYKKSRHTRHQDIESNGDQSEPLLTTRSPAERENRQTETTTGENINQQSETEQLENKPKTLLSELKEVKQELENQKDRNSELQEDNKQLHDTLDKVRTELENQKDQLLQKLRDVETKRKENKEELQMVVDKITEKETSDDKDLLLEEKEKLLKSQWKLDEDKKHNERQILSIEKVMEPIEMNMMRTTEKNKDVKKTAEDVTKLSHQDVEPRYDEREPLLINKTLSTGGNTQFPENETTSENLNQQKKMEQLENENKMWLIELNRTKEKLENKTGENSKLQSELDQLQQDNKELCDIENEAEHEQENHEGQKVQQPQDDEINREDQMVEEKLVEIKSSDEEELLLKEKKSCQAASRN